MTKKDHEDFKKSTKYQIYEKAYEEGKLKVKDHDKITRKDRGSGFQEFNLNVNLTTKSLLCFIMWKTVIHILFFKKLVKRTKEKDSVYFLINLFNNLCKNLGEDYFYHLSQIYFANELNIVEKKSFFHDYQDSFEISKEGLSNKYKFLQFINSVISDKSYEHLFNVCKALKKAP